MYFYFRINNNNPESKHQNGGGKHNGEMMGKYFCYFDCKIIKRQINTTILGTIEFLLEI